MAMLSLRQFELFHIGVGKTKWFEQLINKLVEKKLVTPKARRNLHLISLLYQAHRLGTKLIVIHDDYVCPDYQGDYSSLYSRIARPPSQRTTRLLFFKSDMEDEDILFHLQGGIPVEGGWLEEGQEEDTGLVGLAVIRPTPDCLIGRTVLAATPEDGYIHCADSYMAHLYGTPLYVRGVPWLQQDSSQFVCGGAALWACAFHTQTRWGLPHYSPGELTALARRFSVSGHVSKGMSVSEMATAIREWGFEPYCEVWHAGDGESRREQLFASLHMLLESKISVVLGYWPSGRTGHAVLAVGHELSKKMEYTGGESHLRPTTAWINRFVVADDQRSPYTPLLLRGKKGALQHPVFHKAAIAWAGTSREELAEALPLPTRPLDQCGSVTIAAPFPKGVRVLPEDVLDITRSALAQAPSMITSKDTNGNEARAVEFRKPFNSLAGNGDTHLLRPYLTQLKDFHWDLKVDPAWTELAEGFRAEYLQIAWPTWLWVVQIIKISPADNGEVDWAEAKVVGEVLIDATGGPKSKMGGAFSARVGKVMLYFPDRLRNIIWSKAGSTTYPLP